MATMYSTTRPLMLMRCCPAARVGFAHRGGPVMPGSWNGLGAEKLLTPQAKKKLFFERFSIAVALRFLHAGTRGRTRRDLASHSSSKRDVRNHGVSQQSANLTHCRSKVCPECCPPASYYTPRASSPNANTLFKNMLSSRTQCP